jgi:hypothetical protein
MGIEPMVRVLQTLALPLGDVAMLELTTSQSYANHLVLSTHAHRFGALPEASTMNRSC